MKKIIQTVAAVVIIVSMAGCASPKAYFVDRGHDAVDIFTLSAGKGTGARVRAGPIHAGALYNGVDVGLRYGAISWNYGAGKGPTDGEVSIDCWEAYNPANIIAGSESRCRSKAYVVNTYHGGISMPFVTTGDDFQLIDSASKTHCLHPYWTQIEIQGGLYYSVRLGFNPGELLDFILGWTTIDIFKDDLKATKQEEKSNQVSHRTDNPAVVVR